MVCLFRHFWSDLLSVQLGSGDSSVAKVSINISENIFYSVIDPLRVAPSEWQAKDDSQTLKPVFEKTISSANAPSG